MSKLYDIVIVGTGIGGLSTLLYLIESAPFRNGEISIAIVAKEALDCTNTNWAQGGIAAVHAIEDSFEKHIQDTLVAGAFMNNELIVRKVVQAAPDLMQDLIRWGTLFDKNAKEEFDLAKEGGHSDARIWHYKDQTGYAIEQALLTQLKQFETIDVLAYHHVTQIVQLDGGNFQLQLYDCLKSIFVDISSSKLVLATGGLGMLYEKTTNQKIATGDGVYFAKKLGAKIKDLSFIQFHPTGLYAKQNNTFLISEALRGAGAVLKDIHGNAFMKAYDPRADLAPRDIVSRSIVDVMKKTNASYVYLDATNIDKHIIDTHFPSIQQKCFDMMGIEIYKDLIPIVPVQHYACGGIEVDEFGETNVINLFAIGEVASTGLHGANRLASNSLLEAIAFAKFATYKLLNDDSKLNAVQAKLSLPKFKIIDINLVQKTLSESAGVLRSNKGLSQALKLLKDHEKDSQYSEEFNIKSFEEYIVLENAIELLEDAIHQKANHGVHYNIDLA